MGMSPTAKLAYAVIIGDDDYSTGGISEESYEHIKETGLEDEIDRAAGWTESEPEGHWRTNEAEWSSFWGRRSEYRAAYVLIDHDYFGSDSWSGHVLVVGKSITADWSYTVVDALPPAPSDEAVAQLNAVLEAIEFTGDRTPQLLLSVYYG